MDVRGLARMVSNMMKDDGIRKTVKAQRHNLYISDDEGNKSTFVLKHAREETIFQTDDVEAILKYCIQAIETLIQRGESINVRGFGKLEVKYREPRRTRDIETGEWVDVAGRYVPKFTFGSDLRTMARLYESSLTENELITRADRELSEEELEE